VPLPSVLPAAAAALGGAVAAAAAAAAAHDPFAHNTELDEEACVAVGGGGLNFEEYLTFRGFATAGSLESQFRFLWRLLDRDGDGVLSRDDLSTALRIQHARLGWDESTASGWVTHVLDVARARAGAGRTQPGPGELLAALEASPQLRTVLMAREPVAAAGAAPRSGAPSPSLSW
jgi:hypothetical protein